MNRTVYYPGGFIAAAAASNVREEWNGLAVTYTSWDVSGTQTSTRALTTVEISDFAAQDAVAHALSNAATLRARAQAALAANNTYLAIGSPTTAQAVAQVQLLTKECNAMIRLAISQLDSVTGT